MFKEHEGVARWRKIAIIKEEGGLLHRVLRLRLPSRSQRSVTRKPRLPHDIPRTGRVYYLPVSEPGEPTISMGKFHYRETNLPNLRSWRDGRRHRHAQFPARQQVCPKDAPGRPPFRPDGARLTRC